MLTVRSEESETGIQVFDHNGNPVGMSKAAGEKVFLNLKKKKKEISNFSEILMY